jgi:DNA-binding response OmpR family regulator
MSSKILVVEDDPDVMELIRTGLAFKEYETLGCAGGKEAIELAKKAAPDLVILDLMLPDVDGLKVCATLKADEATRTIPIIMLTARSEVIDIVKGLESGANDYVTKPFEVMELIARVRAQLRLAEESKGPPKVLRKDGLVLDRTRRSVEYEGETRTNLTEKEFAILFKLVHNASKVLGRKEIFESVWGTSYPGKSRTIDVHVQRIREKAGPALAKRLLSVKGQGYRFV